MTGSITPTREQQVAIEYDGNLVIIASPGSGKTFVMAEKIRHVLSTTPAHKGVIAISYTNKASSELKRRSLGEDTGGKSSYFGTIDGFCDSEIIFPFLPHLWGRSAHGLAISRIEDLPPEEKAQFLMNWSVDIGLDDLKQQIDLFKDYYRKGLVFLEANGALALYTYLGSAACRSYIRARYTHVFVDEYQDSGADQHSLFVALHQLGLICTAVGDARQSIFGFSGKSPKYLMELAANESFRTCAITLNHRCHPSIINYSLRIIDKDASLIPIDANHVFGARIQGTQKQVGIWIDRIMPKLVKSYDIAKLSDVAILSRGNKTAEIVCGQLSMKHRLIRVTPLEERSSSWSRLFHRLLDYFYSEKSTAQDIVADLRDRLISSEHRYLSKQIRQIRMSEEPQAEQLIAIAEMVFPSGGLDSDRDLLKSVLSMPNLADMYAPADDDEVQVMTLHKAKGSEFDLVFHLDLYDFVFPGRFPNKNGQYVYGDRDQDLNLHYVGITRARVSVHP